MVICKASALPHILSVLFVLYVTKHPGTFLDQDPQERGGRHVCVAGRCGGGSVASSTYLYPHPAIFPPSLVGMRFLEREDRTVLNRGL